MSISIKNINESSNSCEVERPNDSTSYIGSVQNKNLLAFFEKTSITKISDLFKESMKHASKDIEKFCKEFSCITGDCYAFYLSKEEIIKFKPGSDVNIKFDEGRKKKPKVYKSTINYIFKRNSDGAIFLSVNCSGYKGEYLVPIESLEDIIN